MRSSYRRIAGAVASASGRGGVVEATPPPPPPPEQHGVRHATVILAFVLGCGAAIALTVSGGGTQRGGAVSVEGPDVPQVVAPLLGGAVGPPPAQSAVFVAPARAQLSTDFSADTVRAGPPSPDGWSRENIGIFKDKTSGRCLALPKAPPDVARVEAELRECDYNVSSTSQRWVIDFTTGFIRSLSGSRCLDVAGSPGWAEGAAVGGAVCSWEKDPDSTDQRWKFVHGGLVVNRLSGKCLSANATRASVEIRDCGVQHPGAQSWAFVSITQVATAVGALAGRPYKALSEEAEIRNGVRNAHASLLVFDDVAQVSDPLALLGGKFSSTIGEVFARVTPTWNEWDAVFDLAARLESAGLHQRALGVAILSNLVSNGLFAATNFVQGFSLPDIRIPVLANSTISVQQFHPARFLDHGCSPYGFAWMSFCRWPKTAVGEAISVNTFAGFLQTHTVLQSFAPFETIFVGDAVPSWEDADGVDAALATVSSGLAVLRNRGVDIIEEVVKNSEPRFAFDVEGLRAMIGQGFGFFRPREVVFAWNGVVAAPLIEQLLETRDRADVLGVLLSETALSMHLTFDRNRRQFVLDLMDFAALEPLPGYAPLGGKATLEDRNGRLVTVELEYAGEVFTDFSGSDPEVQYEEASSLHGWRFAEKAIIATLMAKTQLLVHVKRIHLELAPALQVVTVNALHAEHPLRRLLEPFISRSVQATSTNLRVWFEFRAGTFGLAPLSLDAQLRLVANEMATSPTNLADLDMTRFAAARGMQDFTGDTVPAGRWAWKWHQRALSVQQKMSDLVECWLDLYTGGDEAALLNDQQVVAWWSTLQSHMSAVIAAKDLSSDFVVDATTTSTKEAPTTTTPQRIVQAAPAPVQATFLGVKELHPDEPRTGDILAARTTPAPLFKAVWKRRRLQAGAAAEGLSHASLRRVLSTLMVWVSWIHEDVGHGMAPLIYDPVHAPMFVPADGFGVPMAPFTLVASAYRDFVLLERPKLLDPPPDHWFDKQRCHKVVFVTQCEDPVPDRQCYTDFQDGLKELQLSHGAFAECDVHGFHSCMDRVETSASS